MSNRTAPDGAVVKIFVDSDELIREGHVVETRSGRRYLVLSVRLQLRGKHIGRHHLSALVVPKDDACPTQKTHRIRWYARTRGAGVKGSNRR